MNEIISVIIPVYNVEPYIDKCVKSVLEQSYGYFQCILVDDGSTDSSGDLCDEYAKRDDRVEVIHKKNGGLSSARNAGLENAKGEYIFLLDGDDWIASSTLGNLLRVLQQTKGDIAQGHIVKTTQEDIKDSGTDQFSYSEVKLTDYLKRLYQWCGPDCISLCNKLYRRKLWKDVVFPFERLFEDMYINYLIYSKAKGIYECTFNCYYYRVRIGSICNKYSIFDKKDYYEAIIKRYNYYIKTDMQENIKFELEFFMFYLPRFYNRMRKGKDKEFLKGIRKEFHTYLVKLESFEKPKLSWIMFDKSYILYLLLLNTVFRKSSE